MWIAKPGGLSRGRNIKIFNNFNEILAYTNSSECVTNTVVKDPLSFGPKTWIV